MRNVGLPKYFSGVFMGQLKFTGGVRPIGWVDVLDDLVYYSLDSEEY